MYESAGIWRAISLSSGLASHYCMIHIFKTFSDPPISVVDQGELSKCSTTRLFCGGQLSILKWRAFVSVNENRNEKSEKKTASLI